MEYTLGFLITGTFILLATLYRLRKIRQHSELQQSIREKFDVSSLDLTGNTRYVSCYSHNWVMNNISRKSHSRIGAILQDHLADNTLLAGMWIGFVVVTSSMIITILFVESLRAIGTVVVIFLVGSLIALGPGGPRYSESLLDAVMKIKIDELNAQDYVYVKIANDTIKRSIAVNVLLALVFILISPWAEILPILLAQGIAFLTVYLIWEPASLFLNINIAFAIIYIAGTIGVGSFVCFKLGQRFIMKEEEPPSVQY